MNQITTPNEPSGPSMLPSSQFCLSVADIPLLNRLSLVSYRPPCRWVSTDEPGRHGAGGSALRLPLMVGTADNWPDKTAA
jgi:hypothetical protein